MYKDIEFFKTGEYRDMKLRPNVVRLVPFTKDDVDNLVTAEYKVNTRRIDRMFMAREKPAIKVFYGKLSPDTTLKGLGLHNVWMTGGTVGKTGRLANPLIDAGINTAKSSKNLLAKAIGHAADIGVNIAAAAEQMTGINLTSVGAYTLKEFKGCEFKIPSVKCTYYMPADVDFAIKSLTDLFRLVYPNTLSEASARNALEGAFVGATELSSKWRAALTGYTRTSRPTPMLLQLGQWLDVAPVCLTSVNVTPSGVFYTHTDAEGLSITMPQMLVINMEFCMYMNMPSSKDYVWLSFLGETGMFNI